MPSAYCVARSEIKVAHDQDVDACLNLFFVFLLQSERESKPHFLSLVLMSHCIFMHILPDDKKNL